MNKPILFFFSLLLFLSCNTGKEDQSAKTDTNNNLSNFEPPQVTILADLPDSLKPKTFLLENMPRPLSAVAGKGETRIPPVLLSEKGEPILDSKGEPFILGNGGRSNITTLNTDDGLALDAIYSSLTDKAGNLWFGTGGGGVSRYDGKTFTNFTTAEGLASDLVYCIIEDTSGNIWFGTGASGVSRYDGKTFINYTTEDGLPSNRVWSIAEDKAGNFWFGTKGGGISRYDGKTFTNYTIADGLAHNFVNNIMEDKSGILWFGTAGGVSRYDGKTFKTFTTAEGLAHNEVYAIEEDKSGVLWFGTHGGVSRYDGKHFKTFTTADGLANNLVRSIAAVGTGDLWFGTTGGGVSLYDGKAFTTFTTAQGLSNNDVWTITEDKSGNIWFGTLGGGVSRYAGKAFTSITTAQGLAQFIVWGIAEDKSNNLWFGTRFSGVSQFDGKNFKTFTTEHGMPHNNVWSIYNDKSGNLWFGTSNGVSRYDGMRFTNFNTDHGLTHNGVRSITEDKAGNLWFGTFGGGVSRYDGKTFTNYTTDQGLGQNLILVITEDRKGNLWFGSYGGGVSRYDGKTFTTFKTAQGLASDIVLDITMDKAGNLWFGTSQGLSLMPMGYDPEDTGEGISNKPITNFRMVDGLPDNFVTNVLQLSDGRMAIGTNLGITFFNVSEDLTTLRDIEVYNSDTGFPIKDVNAAQNCMYLDSKGILWAGTGSERTSLVRFDYKSLKNSQEPPNVLIESIKIRDEAISWFDLKSKGIRANSTDSSAALIQEYLAYGKTPLVSENNSKLNRFGNIQFDSINRFYPWPKNLVLPYEHNQIGFEFVAIETDRPFLVRYQYMLEGYDEDWLPATERSNANFGNIYEGTYTFKLKAQGANGVWSAPISYTFEVLPPWYRTWWAYATYALLFGLALRAFSKWRERNLLEEKEKLESTVEQRTEELVQKNLIVEQEKKRSDDLLLNILPEEVAEELKSKGSADAKQFDEVTVLFTDFRDFTRISETMTPHELVEELNTFFKEFDQIITRLGIEKIKTIGDSYMCVGGLPKTSSTHAEDVVQAGIEIQRFVEKQSAARLAAGKDPLMIRIGIYTGPVIAGIVGLKKYAYDIWGDTVNTASRMESNGEVGKINIGGTTYELVKNKFSCTHRGKIKAKGKGELDMYFVEGRTG